MVSENATPPTMQGGLTLTAALTPKTIVATSSTAQAVSNVSTESATKVGGTTTAGGGNPEPTTTQRGNPTATPTSSTGIENLSSTTTKVANIPNISTVGVSDKQPDTTKIFTAITAPPALTTTKSTSDGPYYPLDFNISSLSNSTKEQLNNIATQYNMTKNDNTVTLEGKAMNSLLEIAQAMSLSERANLGFSLQDLLISCSYNSEPCDYENDFSTMWDPDYGNCYTFNYATKYSSSRAGSQFGLRMVALSNVTEYLYSSSKAGMRISIHKQNYDPFPNTEGYSTAVGTAVSIAIRYEEMERLSKPYGNCVEKKNSSTYFYDGQYTFEGCFRSCFQSNVIKSCGCADPRFPLPPKTNIAYCSSQNINQINCYQAYIEKNGDFDAVTDCYCPMGCDEPMYDASLTRAKWPSSPKFMSPSCVDIYPGTNLSCAQVYSDNAVLLEVYFDRLGFQLTKERPVMTLVDLLNLLAGTAGLWLSISFCTMAEFIVLLVQLLRVCCCAYKGVASIYANHRAYYIHHGMAIPKSVSDKQREIDRVNSRQREKEATRKNSEAHQQAYQYS
uniref:Uncharacterized protein n=1 Tax=Plectus sambesii TaxID=2011161 RepID=A0A914VH32_9BILA